MSAYTWNQNGPGAKSLSGGRIAKCERACLPQEYGTGTTFPCYPDVFYAVRLIPAHRRWQYEDDERYVVEYSEGHLTGRWIETIGHARTQRQAKALAEKHLEQTGAEQ